MQDPGEERPGRAAIRLGVVLERRRIDHPWQKWRISAVAVVMEPPELPVGHRMVVGEEFERVHGGTLTLRLFRDETDAYKYNLSASRPSVYVVLREDEAAPWGWRPVLASVSPWDAQAHSETADDRVDAVPMPEPLIARVKAFVDRWHVDRPFYKRRRKGRDRGPGEASEFVRLGGGGGEES